MPLNRENTLYNHNSVILSCFYPLRYVEGKVLCLVVTFKTIMVVPLKTNYRCVNMYIIADCEWHCGALSSNAKLQLQGHCFHAELWVL